MDPPAPRAPDRARPTTRRRARCARSRSGAPERRARGAAARVGGARGAAPTPASSGPLVARARPRRRRRGGDRPRRLAGDRDAGPRAVARRPAPARAAAADLRRPRAGPDRALLRLRLVARTRWASSSPRSTASRTSTSGSRSPATAAVHRPARPRRRQPRARRASGWTRCSAALAAHGAATAFELLPDVFGERVRRRAGARRLLVEAARLPRPPRGSAGAGACAARASRSAGPPPRLGACGSTSGSPRRRALVLVRVLPAEDRRGRAQPGPRAGRALAPGPDVRVRHLRRGRQPDASGARRSTSSATSSATTAWRRWRTSPASAPRRTSCARCSTRCATAGVENVLALRGDPPQGETEWTRDRGRARVLARADRADPRRVRVRDRRGVLPRGPHPRDRRRERPALPQGEGRRGRALPDHAAVLRQPGLLRLRRPGARDRHRRPDHPRHLADHERGPDQAGDGDVRGEDPRRACCASSSCAATSRARSPTSASPTRRCSAPTCWPTARPGSTSTRSTARRRRGRSSPRCGCMAPWRGAVPA